MTTLAQYDAARTALANATRVDQVLSIRDEVEHLKLYARQIRDKALLGDAYAFQIKVEHKLGLVLIAAREKGQIADGRPNKGETVTDEVQFPRVTLEDVGISRNLSSRAQKLASISEQALEVLANSMRERIASGAAKLVDREADTQDKRTRRDTRERILGGIQQALPTKKYGVILADPEWRFEPWSRSTGMDRAADNHYPTSCTEVIAARDVPSIATDDCVLFLWATAPMLPHALLVMAAWGFDYRSNFVWAKDRIGTGYWNRNKHEHLLIGVRGKIPAPAMGTQADSLIEAAVGAHSAKPEIFHEWIEEYFPTLPKIELNRRGPARPGWDAWGNEADDGSPTDPVTGEIAAA